MESATPEELVEMDQRKGINLIKHTNFKVLSIKWHTLVQMLKIMDSRMTGREEKC